MAQQRISLIKFRRGTKDQRVVTKFEEGEPVYETDTKRLFIGVGDNEAANLGSESIGGTLTGNLSYISDTQGELTDYTIPRAYVGDILFAKNKIWRKAEAGWTDISPKVDGTTIKYNNNNVLTVTQQKFTVGAGNGIEVTDGTTVAIKLNGSTLSFNNGGLQINSNSITVDQINTNTFYSRQFKRVNNQYQLNLNDTYFNTPTDNSGVTIKGVPAGYKDDTLTNNVGTVNAIISDRFRNQDYTSGITLDENNNIALSDFVGVHDEDTNELIGFNLGIDTTYISDGTNTHNPGNPCDTDEIWQGDTSLNEATIYDSDTYDDISSLNAGIIKSGGFIVINSGRTKNGRSYGRLAIPVYTIPDGPDIIYFSANISNPMVYGTGLGGVRVIKNNSLDITSTVTYTDKQLETGNNTKIIGFLDPAPQSTNASLTFQPLKRIETLAFREAGFAISPIPYELTNMFGSTEFIPTDSTTTDPVLIKHDIYILTSAAKAFNSKFAPSIDFTNKIGYAVYVFLEGFNLGTTAGDINTSNIIGIQSIEILPPDSNIDISQVITGGYNIYPKLNEASHGSAEGTNIINIPSTNDNIIKSSAFVGYIAFPQNLGNNYLKNSIINSITLSTKNSEPIKLTSSKLIELP